MYDIRVRPLVNSSKAIEISLVFLPGQIIKAVSVAIVLMDI